MFKMILKRTLIFSFILSSESAISGKNKEFLANQCYELSRFIVSLSANQNKIPCINKLNMASIQMGTAAMLILDEEPDAAKEILNNAIIDLHYAQLLSCSRYIQIAHSKLEIQKIKKLL